VCTVFFTYEYTYAAVNSNSENLLCGPYLNYTFLTFIRKILCHLWRIVFNMSVDILTTEYFITYKHHHHHHHWLDSPTWALAFLRSFCQLKYPAIASSDFVTRVFSKVRLSAPYPTPSYPGGLMSSVRVVCLP
jgi:hypothetical protein